MSDLRAWARAGQHLNPDALVAFVDGELSALAHDRASAHLAGCACCAAEAAAQRQARAAVRSASMPGLPSGLLDSLRSIPQQVELPQGPDELAVTPDGQLVAVLRPGRVGAAEAPAGLGSSPMMGSSPMLGQGSSVLGRRRSRQGTGVVVSGLVLGVLALVSPAVSDLVDEQWPTPPQPGARAAQDRSPQPSSELLSSLNSLSPNAVSLFTAVPGR
ncbi:hypothetical protein [Allokutzneria oryzae]|uniref:Zinc-finger domain-containing protein n=1 Tax=Allokutzneria oryzae TaxID=1378989 RepID=A0ABV6A2F8_9PSEU